MSRRSRPRFRDGTRPSSSAPGAAGAVVVARSNMPDFGMRWHTDSGTYGATVNPWETTGVIPSASDLPPLDPSPTLQLFGVQGPMARSVDDLAAAFGVLRGRHPRDPLSLDAVLRERPDRPPVALVVDPGGLGVDGEVAAGVHRAADSLRAAGHEVHEVDPAVVVEAARLWLSLVVTDLQVTLAGVLRQIGSPGAVRFLDDFLAIAEDLDRDGYVGALVQRHALSRAWAELTASYPLVLGPVAADGTSAVGRDLSGPDAVRDMWKSHRLLVAANLLGAPALALPTGLDNRGLPTGVQLVTGLHGELDLLAAARTVERDHPHVAAPLR